MKLGGKVDNEPKKNTITFIGDLNFELRGLLGLCGIIHCIVGGGYDFDNVHVYGCVFNC